MKKIFKLSIFCSSVVLAGTVYINPLSITNRAIDNGGSSMSAIDAYQDGIGAYVLSNLSIDSVNNTAMNTLTLKYGEVAKANNTTIVNQVLNGNSNPTSTDLILASTLLHADGTLCDDGDPSTHGETWLNNTCQGGIDNVYRNGITCDDGNPATTGETWLNDVCQGGLVTYVGTSFVDGTSCDDGNTETINDVYTNNVCAGTIPVISTPNNTCNGGFTYSTGLIIQCSGDNTSGKILGQSLPSTYLSLVGPIRLLWITNQFTLTNIDNLINVTGVNYSSIFLVRMYQLTNLNGLANLKTLPGSVYLNDNPKLTDISGLNGVTTILPGGTSFHNQNTTYDQTIIFDNKDYAVKIRADSPICTGGIKLKYMQSTSTGYKPAYITKSKVCY
jgi:hypothetical protein